VYISGIWGKIPLADWAQIFWEEHIRDVITCFKFGDDRLIGSAAEGQILPVPIDFDGRPYNTLKQPCESVMSCVFSRVAFKTSNKKYSVIKTYM